MLRIENHHRPNEWLPVIFFDMQSRGRGRPSKKSRETLRFGEIIKKLPIRATIKTIFTAKTQNPIKYFHGSRTFEIRQN